MAIQTINIGQQPNDGTGDNVRVAFGKANDNFGELDQRTAAATAAAAAAQTDATQALADAAAAQTDATQALAEAYRVRGELPQDNTHNLDDWGVAQLGIWFQRYSPSATLAQNYPVAAGGTLEILPRSNAFGGLVVQRYTRYTDGRTYTRSQNGTGTWSSWERLDTVSERNSALANYAPLSGLGSAAFLEALGTGPLYGRDSILGAVSHSGGVPTGAIIERGSNANGEYVRWADGTQICLLSTTVTDQAINNAYGGLYQGTRAWTYPAGFITGPVVACSEFRWGNGASWGTLGGTPGINSVTLRAIDASSRAAGTTVSISAIAVGRWY